jgi:hypothetical protein
VLRSSLDAIREHVASLSVETNVPGAELWVEEHRVGSLPMGTLRVASGRVRIEIRSNGYETVQRSLDIAPGQTATEMIELTPVHVTLPSTSVEKGPAPSALPAPPKAADGATQRVVAWGMLGAAGAFLGGALAAQAFREGKVAHYNDDRQCYYGTQTRDERCGSDKQQAGAAQAFANVGYIAAGATAISATLLFLIKPSPPTRSGSPSLSIGVSASTVLLGYGGEL